MFRNIFRALRFQSPANTGTPELSAAVPPSEDAQHSQESQEPYRASAITVSVDADAYDDAMQLGMRSGASVANSNLTSLQVAVGETATAPIEPAPFSRQTRPSDRLADERLGHAIAQRDIAVTRRWFSVSAVADARCHVSKMLVHPTPNFFVIFTSILLAGLAQGVVTTATVEPFLRGNIHPQSVLQTAMFLGCLLGWFFAAVSVLAGAHTDPRPNSASKPSTSLTIAYGMGVVALLFACGVYYMRVTANPRVALGLTLAEGAIAFAIHVLGKAVGGKYRGAYHAGVELKQAQSELAAAQENLKLDENYITLYEAQIEREYRDRRARDDDTVTLKARRRHLAAARKAGYLAGLLSNKGEQQGRKAANGAAPKIYTRDEHYTIG